MIGAFVCGFAYEVLFLVWIFCADRGWPLPTAAMSMIVGAVSLAGLTGAIADRMIAVALVAGYGCGSYAAARWRRALRAAAD